MFLALVTKQSYFQSSKRLRVNRVALLWGPEGGGGQAHASSGLLWLAVVATGVMLLAKGWVRDAGGPDTTGWMKHEVGAAAS